MNIPFNTEQFLGVFQVYNDAIWPAQLIGYIVAVMALIAVSVKYSRGVEIESAIPVRWPLDKHRRLRIYDVCDNRLSGFGTFFRTFLPQNPPFPLDSLPADHIYFRRLADSHTAGALAHLDHSLCLVNNRIHSRSSLRYQTRYWTAYCRGRRSNFHTCRWSKAE